MFYKTNVVDFIRVSPDFLNLEKETRVTKEIKRKYESFIDKDIGIVIDVSKINKVGEGKIIPGDGSSFMKLILNC